MEIFYYAQLSVIQGKYNLIGEERRRSASQTVHLLNYACKCMNVYIFKYIIIVASDRRSQTRVNWLELRVSASIWGNPRIHRGNENPENIKVLSV